MRSTIDGTISGFSAGLLMIGDAIRGITMLVMNLGKKVLIATASAIDLGIDMSGFVVYIPYLLMMVFIGCYLGKHILNTIAQEGFKIISQILMPGIDLPLSSDQLCIYKLSASWASF